MLTTRQFQKFTVQLFFTLFFFTFSGFILAQSCNDCTAIVSGSSITVNDGETYCLTSGT